jgi:hypothetical protein
VREPRLAKKEAAMLPAIVLTIGILLLPAIVLSPVLDRFVNGMLGIPQMRAIVRKAFGIDRTATIADVLQSEKSS